MKTALYFKQALEACMLHDIASDPALEEEAKLAVREAMSAKDLPGTTMLKAFSGTDAPLWTLFRRETPLEMAHCVIEHLTRTMSSPEWEDFILFEASMAPYLRQSWRLHFEMNTPFIVRKWRPVPFIRKTLEFKHVGRRSKQCRWIKITITSSIHGQNDKFSRLWIKTLDTICTLHINDSVTAVARTS